MSTFQNQEKRIAKFRFYACLNDFLKKNERQQVVNFPFTGPITIREALESLKVPVSEIALLLVNGQSENSWYNLKANDFISVYPEFKFLNISGFSKIVKVPFAHVHFIADVHLGKLAKYLRMMGFDTIYQNYYTDDQIREIASDQQRIILTRDKELLMRKNAVNGYFVRATHPHEQVREVMLKFNLFDQIKAFTRCLICNGLLCSVSKESVLNSIDSDTAEAFDEFYTCKACSKIYWKGSHYERMSLFIELQNLKYGVM